MPGNDGNARLGARLAALSRGGLEGRRAAAVDLAATDVRGEEQAVLAAFRSATDDVVRLWIATALARAGSGAALEELFQRWLQRRDDGVLQAAYPQPDTLAERLAEVLPLHRAVTPLLEKYARSLAGTWPGDLAQMLLGRWEVRANGGHGRTPPARNGGVHHGPQQPRAGGGGGAVYGRVVNGAAFYPGGADFGGGYGPAAGTHAGAGANWGSAPLPPPPSPAWSFEGHTAPERRYEETTAAEPPYEAATAAEPPDEATTAAEPPLDAATSAAPSQPSAPAGPEPVLLGGSAPRRARPGDVVLAHFTAYVAAFEQQARGELPVESASDQVRLGVETDCRWAVGTRVTVRCTVRGLPVPPLTGSFVWDGECRTVSFDVEVPADAPPRKVVIRMEAFVHDRDGLPDAVQVGSLGLPIEIADEADDGPPQRVTAEAPRTAFASYASKDRLDVLERASSIRRSAGLEVWVDALELRMGDRWNPELEKHILASDRFLLFWSEHTRDSEWVKWEREHAVKAHGEDVLELHLLRHTAIEDVPEDLRQYHFDDKYLRARDAELYRQQQAEARARDAAGGA